MSRVVIRDSRSIESVSPFTIDAKEVLEPFTLDSMYSKASFDSNGMLTAVTRDGHETPLAIQFVHYGTRRGQSMSGAYLFLPDGPARVLEPSPDHHVRIIEGSIHSQVVVHMPFVIHQITLHRSPGVDGVGLEINNLVNVADQTNLEVAMRFVTGINSGRSFYSDLNGLQVCSNY